MVKSVGIISMLNFYRQEEDGTIIYHGIITNINTLKEQQERAEKFKRSL